MSKDKRVVSDKKCFQDVRKQVVVKDKFILILVQPLGFTSTSVINRFAAGRFHKWSIEMELRGSGPRRCMDRGP